MQLPYVGKERVLVAKRIQSIMENEGFIITLEQSYNLWLLYCNEVAFDWVYPEDDMTDGDIYDKIIEHVDKL